ncbi:MAG TPA: tetratricopeptide repeat protein, partial [Anaerolineae bacterium]
PEADHIFSALAGFYTASVAAYTPLVLAFAAHLWHRYRLHPLRQTLTHLSHFDVVVQRDQVSYPDFVAEEQPERDAVAPKLEPFLRHYRRLFHRPLLRRLYPHAESHMWALFDLARSAELRQEFTEVTRLYSAALHIHSHFGVYNNRGIAYRAQGELAAAIEDYTQAITLNPDDATAYNNRGIAYRQLGQLDRALADFNRALELAPDDDWYLYSRSLVLLVLDHSEPAAADLNRAIDVAQQAYGENPQDWRNTFNLAIYHLAAGNAATAEQLYNEALIAPPTYLREAIQDLDDFLHLFPEHSQALSVRAPTRQTRYVAA